jgi:hypothetical protein
MTLRPRDRPRPVRVQCHWCKATVGTRKPRGPGVGDMESRIVSPHDPGKARRADAERMCQGSYATVWEW